jgi:hypothetical protein
MAHFAKLDNDNTVLQVIVVDNNDILDENGNESEEVGINFCTQLLGGIWKQTSYNATFRKNYAGIGFTYDNERDAFIPPKPFSKWVLNEDTCNWEAPVAYPDDEKRYAWNDNKGEWEELVIPE